MSENVSRHHSKEKLFQFFKYAVYVLIFFNIFYWLREDYLASSHIYRNGISWANIGDAFAQAVDTFAWFILLIAFELETYAVSDDNLKGRVKWALNLVAGICYFLIVISFIGYAEKFGMAFAFEPAGYETACAAVGEIYAYAIDLDDYVDLTAANCADVGMPLYVNTKVSLLSNAEVLTQMHWLATAEVINAGVWIMIVLLLWIDVFIQLRGIEHGKMYRINLASKVLLYITLIVVCIYWGYAGDFMDFWDAFLWIVAFFFIELNLFKWAEENELADEKGDM